MYYEQKHGLLTDKKILLENYVKKTISGISANVQRKYDIIDLRKVPDHVNYSKVEKYLRSVNIDITRRMFSSYLKENILPGEHEVKNTRLSFYTKDQIIYYILVDMFKPILQLNKVKRLFNEILKPMIDDTGIISTYKTLCKMINDMVIRFEETIAAAIKAEQKINEDFGLLLQEDTDSDIIKIKNNISHYLDLVLLSMVKGAWDFYKNSPNSLLEDRN